MAKSSGLDVRLYLDGYDLSGDASALQNLGYVNELLQVPTLDKSAMQRLMGRGDGRLTINSWFDPGGVGDQDHTHVAVLSSGNLKTADVDVLVPLGSAIGDPCAMLVAKEASYEVNRQPGNAVATTVTLQTNDNGLEFGQMLTAHKDTHASATNGTAVDNGTSSANGGVGMVQVFSVATGTATPVIQDSADNITFAALITFTAVATAGAPTAERATVTGTVDRYTRFATTGTFTNAVVACGFLRN